MKSSVQALLDGVFDYAGLFPPASLSIGDAVAEMGRLAEGPADSLIGGVVCPSHKLADLERELAASGFFEDGFGLPTTVVLSLLPGESSGESLAAARKAMESLTWLEVVALEVKLDPKQVPAWAKQLKNEGMLKEIDVLLELGLGPDHAQAMEAALSAWEGFGFKARLGGPSPADIPSAAHVAEFIGEVAGLDVAFKLTAGLHHPLRHLDAATGHFQHGFLNCLAAAAAAFGHEAPAYELERILCLESIEDFEFGEAELRAGGRDLRMDDIEMMREYCSGIGSCSIDEPYEGLVRLGVIPA